MHNTKRSVPSCKKLFTSNIFLLKLIGLGFFGKAFEDKNNLIRNLNLNIINIFFFTTAIFSLLILDVSLVKTAIFYYGTDLSIVCDLISLVFSISIILVKLVRLWSCRADFFHLFQLLNYTWEKNIAKRTHLKSEIVKIIDSSMPINYFYLFNLVAMTVCFTLRPHIGFLVGLLMPSRNETTLYDPHVYSGLLWPFKADGPIKNAALLVFEHQVAYFAVIYFVVCELLFVSLTAVITANFMVLANDYTNLFEIYNKNDENVDQVSDLIKRHCLIITLCREISSLYNPIVLYTLVFNGLDLCLIAFSIQQDLLDGSKNLGAISRNLPHAITLSIQIVTYCNCAHLVTETTNGLRDAVYNSSWVTGDKKMVKTVSIIMVYSQLEFTFMAYSIMTLNREQLSRVFNTTISYFMLLRNLS